MLTLVLGGARSGKSGYAQSLAEKSRAVVFIATAAADADPEMEARIRRHRAQRPRSWTTIEAPLQVPEAIASASSGSLVLLDCVTLWIANLRYALRALPAGEREEKILSRVQELADLGRLQEIVAVTNDVGSGIVPENPIGREFRDLQGRANQMLARAADRVVMMVAGIPLDIKTESG